MTILNIVLSRQTTGSQELSLVDRINGCVCVDGSYLYRTSSAIEEGSRYVLAYPNSGKPFEHRFELTPQETATFVRNFLDEGFQELTAIKFIEIG